jgi:uncharacterized protein (DUF2147 family)
MKGLNMKFFSLTVLFLLFAFTANSQNADAIVGKWLTAKKDAKIEIFKQNNKYFGKIVWLSEPNEDGKPKVDKENPEEKLRSRPIMGLLLLKDFIYVGDNKWKDGEIYDPKSGKTYSCKMNLENPNKLEIRGYIGISLFGRTEVWTKAGN